jgi:oligopeptide transport system substrate-binding protein
MDAAAASGADSEKRMNLLAEAEEEMIENTGIMPLLFFGFQNIVSSKVKGWEENVMDVHPSRFITVER